MKTKDIPLKSPIKLQQEMQKKFEFTKICYIFRAFLKKVVFLENGHGRHQTVASPSKITSFSWHLNGEALLKVPFKNVD